MQHESDPCSTRRLRCLVLPVVVLCSAAVCSAQLSLRQALELRSQGTSVSAAKDELPATPAQTTEDALRAMAQEAAVIFCGQVTAIHPESGAMRVDLHVDQGIRGVTSGETYTLREWMGVWTANAGRFHIGERALLLLHAPSAGGFSSTVGGADGIIPLTGDEVSSAADLRWVAARVARLVRTRPDNAPDDTATYRADTVYAGRGAVVAASAVHQASAQANGVAWPADATNGNVLGPDLRKIDTSLVAGLLRAWNPKTAAVTGGR